MKHVTNPDTGRLEYPSMGDLRREAEGTPDVVVDADGYLQPASTYTDEELDALDGPRRDVVTYWQDLSTAERRHVDEAFRRLGKQS